MAVDKVDGGSGCLIKSCRCPPVLGHPVTIRVAVVAGSQTYGEEADNTIEDTKWLLEGTGHACSQQQARLTNQLTAG